MLYFLTAFFFLYYALLALEYISFTFLGLVYAT